MPGDSTQVGSPGFVTSLDGLWALQVFAGIERVCPELGLRPHDPMTETVDLAQKHPVVAELMSVGAVIDGEDRPRVDQPIVEWLTVLSRREVALVLLVHQPWDDRDLPLRVVLSRFGRWWVSMALFDNQTVRIRPMGTAKTDEAAADLIRREIDNLCGSAPPASSFAPIMVSTDRLRACQSESAVRALMMREGASVDQLRAGLALSASAGCAQVSVVAVQQGQRPVPTVTDHVVTVADTGEGRMLVKNIARNGQRWTVLAAGTPPLIASALTELLVSLPAGEEWHNVRNVFG